jgi:hypothetical protein
MRIGEESLGRADSTLAVRLKAMIGKSESPLHRSVYVAIEAQDDTQPYGQIQMYLPL